MRVIDGYLCLPIRMFHSTNHDMRVPTRDSKVRALPMIFLSRVRSSNQTRLYQSQARIGVLSHLSSIHRGILTTSVPVHVETNQPAVKLSEAHKPGHEYIEAESAYY